MGRWMADSNEFEVYDGDSGRQLTVRKESDIVNVSFERLSDEFNETYGKMLPETSFYIWRREAEALGEWLLEHFSEKPLIGKDQNE